VVVIVEDDDCAASSRDVDVGGVVDIVEGVEVLDDAK
jgi:hypothetical protein